VIAVSGKTDTLSWIARARTASLSRQNHRRPPLQDRPGWFGGEDYAYGTLSIRSGAALRVASRYLGSGNPADMGPACWAPTGFGISSTENMRPAARQLGLS